MGKRGEEGLQRLLISWCQREDMGAGKQIICGKVLVMWVSRKGRCEKTLSPHLSFSSLASDGLKLTYINVSPSTCRYLSF